MHNSDNREGASQGQPQRPAVMPGGLYTRQQLVKNLGVSSDTIGIWIKAGLPTYSPGTKSDLVFGDDVISFIRKNRN